MSGILGDTILGQRLDMFEAALKKRLAEAQETGARQFQSDWADLAGMDSGDYRNAILEADTVSVKKSSDGSAEVTVALTREAKRRVFYGFFNEFGTKGYKAGQKRFSGRKKTGEAKFRKVARDIPARPAQPAFRPAYAILVRNMAQLRAAAHTKALADTVTANVIEANKAAHAA